MAIVCPSWLSFLLYNPVRKRLTDRERVLVESSITPDSIVLEVGAGNGFFTEVIAERAREVYAVELQRGMIRKLQKRVKRFGPKVHILHQDIETLEITEPFADVCLLYFSFHEFVDQAQASRGIAKALRSGGILSIYEPGIEVNRSAMTETVSRFEGLGFVTLLRRDSIFIRFAKLKKYDDTGPPAAP